MPKGLRLSDHLHHLDPVTRELTCPNYQPDLTRNADVLTVKPKVHRSRLCRNKLINKLYAKLAKSRTLEGYTALTEE